TILDRLDLEAVRIGRTFRNFPPATVYRVSRIKNLSTYDWRFS
ncbi:phospholipid methyltransferase, partial [Mesorhizobium sp. M8A.F.Ca.ET.167.01.1.1]